MYIDIPSRNTAPGTTLFAKIIKKNNCPENIWDRKVIILIHGGPGGNHTLYADIEEELLKFADLIEIDLRGCGLSQRDDDELLYCTLENHIEDLVPFIKSLNINKPILHGCSYGAIVALGYSIKYPDSISKLILTSCAVSHSFLGSAKKNLLHVGTQEQIETAKKLWDGTFESNEQFIEYYNIMSPLYFFKKSEQTNIPTNSSSIPYNFKLINLAFTTFLKQFDFQDYLYQVTTDTLIFSGQNDWIFDSTQAEILHNGIARSILVKFPNCGHFPWKEQKKTYLHYIQNFINHTASEPS